MKTKIVMLCLLGSLFLPHANAGADNERRYLAFQIFTTYTPDPHDALALNNGMKERLTPGTAALRSYVEDIKQRIGSVGGGQTRLAVMMGPLCFDQSEAEITEFIGKAFDLALEANVAVGFHIDDSIFWRTRKDLWSDPQNVEALDWDGTPNTSRLLNWSKTPTSAPPQMCFNSKAIQREVQQRSAVIGKAIQTGVNRLQQLKRPELFAGVIVGWETMIGQDFKTGKYLGYRALLNRGFTREHPPQDMIRELESIVQEFIERWTTGIAEAGVSPQRIYSHTAFLSRRAFNMGAFDQRLALEKFAIRLQCFFVLDAQAVIHVLHGFAADAPGEDGDQGGPVVEHLREVGLHAHAALSRAGQRLHVRPLAGGPARRLVLGRQLVNVLEQARLRIGRESRPMVFPKGHPRRRKVIVL